jgi:hypothetical protein
MGLLDQLQQQGSNLTAYDGERPSVNPLATYSSKLHRRYSVQGDSFSNVNAAYQQYLDGVANNLPQPSQLSLGGGNPLPYIYQQPN